MDSEVGIVKKRIHKWLLDERFDVKEIDDRKTYFTFSVGRTPKGFRFLILQPKHRSDSVMFLFPITWGKEEKRAFESMSKESRGDLISRLRVNVAISGTGSILKFVPNPNSFKSINLYKVVFYDGLPKDKFFEVIEVLHNLVRQCSFQHCHVKNHFEKG